MSDYTSIVHGMLGNNQIFVDGDNGDDDWKGTRMQPVKTITAAMALVSSTRKHVIVLPVTSGEYEEAAAVTWPTTSGVKLTVANAHWKTIIKTVSGEDDIFHVAPGAGSGTWEMWMENVCLAVNDGQDGISLIHTSMARKMNCYLLNLGSECEDDDEVIKVTHGGSGNAVRIYMDGRANGDLNGIVYHRFTDEGDKLYCTDVTLAGGADIGTTDIAGTLRLINCVVKHTGITGGHANHVKISMYCTSVTGSTYALVDDDEIVSADWTTLKPTS